jgi:lipopolysaccharide biosynthesis glycosyltransferase
VENQFTWVLSVYSKSVITIAYCIDSKYLIPCLVSISSLSNKHVNIYIYIKDFTKDEQQFLEKFLRKAKYTNIVIDQDNFMKNINISQHHITEVMWSRLSLPIQNNFYYIDADIILNKKSIGLMKSFEENLHSDLSTSGLWAVIHPKYIIDSLNEIKFEFIDQFGYSYFNSGLLYFEATKWNNFLSNINVAEYIKSNNIPNDQIFLNHYCKNKYGTLPKYFNQLVLDNNEENMALNNPDVEDFGNFHFVGRAKPWDVPVLLRRAYVKRIFRNRYVFRKGYRDYTRSELKLILELFRTGDFSLMVFGVRSIRKTRESFTVLIKSFLSRVPAGNIRNSI